MPPLRRQPSTGGHHDRRGGARMMRVSQAAHALGARWAGADAEFNAVSTDSRAISGGELFVALRGERYDGHAFVAQAAAAGAAAAMVEEAGSRIEAQGSGKRIALLLV